MRDPRPGGNVLWDCISLIDDETAAAIGDRGGFRAIALSHSHYYSSIIEWSGAFDDAPISAERYITAIEA